MAEHTFIGFCICVWLMEFSSNKMFFSSPQAYSNMVKEEILPAVRKKLDGP